jgi:small subunit ribosomal protein S8
MNLSDCLNNIKVGELKGQRQVKIRQSSKVLKSVLEIIKAHGFIKDFKFSGKECVVVLNGKINNISAVSPRFPVGFGEWEDFEQRFLPSATDGLIIVSTPKGIKTHAEAKSEREGGVLLAFVY